MSVPVYDPQLDRRIVREVKRGNNTMILLLEKLKDVNKDWGETSIRRSVWRCIGRGELLLTIKRKLAIPSDK